MGISREDAEAFVTVNSEMIMNEVATKAEIEILRADLKVLEVQMENGFTKLESKFDSKFMGFESKFDGLENRFNGLENRFDGLEEKFDNRFAAIENRFAENDVKLNQFKNQIVIQLGSLIVAALTAMASFLSILKWDLF